jgi:hypothetical protein
MVTKLPGQPSGRHFDLGRYRNAATPPTRGHEFGKISKRVKSYLQSLLYRPGYRAALFGQLSMDMDATMAGRGVQPRTLLVLDLSANVLGKHSFWVRFGIRRLSKKVNRLEARK